MSITKTWPSGTTTPAPLTYEIPQTGDLNWGSLTTFLAALADSAQGTGGQRFSFLVDTNAAIAPASGLDCIIIATFAGAKTLTLPVATDKEIIFISNHGPAGAGGDLTIALSGADTMVGPMTAAGDNLIVRNTGTLGSLNGALLVGDGVNNQWIRVF
tara:strand:- start:7218 stop:7688 length:471 start_codon:yes stop_codon:yes gene_type:complete